MLLSQGHDAGMNVLTCRGQEPSGGLTADLREACSAAVREVI